MITVVLYGHLKTFTGNSTLTLPYKEWESCYSLLEELKIPSHEVGCVQVKNQFLPLKYKPMDNDILNMLPVLSGG